MKPQDFMEALGGVSQEKLDALAKWQNAKTPITGEAPAKENRITQTADKPVFAVRRRGTMKQNTKKGVSAAQINPWKIGAGATVAACAVIALSIGVEIMNLNKQKQQMQVGSNVGTSAAEQISESTADEVKNADAAHEPVLLGEPLSEFTAERNEYFPTVSENGSVQVIRSMEDMQPLIDATTSQLQTENYGAEFYDRCGINEALFENNDLLYFAFYNDIFADNMSTAAFCGGKINENGSLTLLFSELIIDNPAEDIPKYGSINCYYFYLAPKGALPDINEINIELEEFHIELPESVREHWNEIDEATGQTIETQYMETAQEKLDYMDSIPEQLYITWGKSKPDLPEDCVEDQVTEPETLPEPFEAWYWVNFKGNSIPLDGITVDLIRTAEDGKKYLTFAQQENLESETYRSLSCDLSKGWLETGKAEDMPDGCDTPDGTPRDMLFIGMPANKMPHNTVKWAYHNGTVTPSGKLHLDFSALTLSDEAAAPLNYEFADDTNFYFFISIPEGAIPELTGWDVTFSDYSIGALPDHETAAAPDEIAANGMTRAQCWINEQPEAESYSDSVLCGKYITPVPEQQSDTVTVTGSYMVNAKNVSPELADEAPTVRFVENFDGRNEDEITLILPVHDYDAATALSDLRISEDGTLSVTLCEYYDKHGIDRTQDTAWVLWKLYVPHGSLSEPKALNLTRADYDKWNLDENFDNMGFIHIAGQLCTVTTE